MGGLPNRKLSDGAVDFIPGDVLERLAKETPEDKARVREVIAKALDKQALSVEETAALLSAESGDLIEEVFAAARELKERVYGNRVVLFAPLYIGNDCVNDCDYCGFRRSNRDAMRRTLTMDEIRSQVTALQDKGHKRLILVYGEHPRYDARFIADTVRVAYSVRSGQGEVRRVNINAAPQDVEGYRIVKEAGIGTYQIFQETYHHATYARVHPAGTSKSDFLWRLDGLDRAMEGGCDDVGIGVLFGLADWKYEVLGLVSHALHLQERYNVGPHTISFPRLQPAQGVNLDRLPLVGDMQFKRLIAVLRLAVPYTGLILTARERPELRRDLMSFGVSQIDAGSRIELGGYTEAGDAQQMDREQFMLGDIRPLDAVMRELLEDGYIPSFCTSCYRVGRTGEHFMEFSVPGFIKRFCTPNALLTLEEYLADYAGKETKTAGRRLIDAEVAKLPAGGEKKRLVSRLEAIREQGERDLYF